MERQSGEDEGGEIDMMGRSQKRVQRCEGSDAQQNLWRKNESILSNVKQRRAKGVDVNFHYVASIMRLA